MTSTEPGRRDAPSERRPRITDVLDLERIDTGIYRGQVIPSALSRTFGGQVASQALVAATRTVGPEYRVHSLHGYFVGPGDSDRPIIFLVDNVRDGRSFRVRSVNAVQDGRTLFVMQASFHIRDDQGPEHSNTIRRVPGPEEISPDLSKTRPSTKAFLKDWEDWDIRIVPPDQFDHDPHAASQQVVWFRSNLALPDDETFHICTLAYMSDMTLLGSALVPHDGEPVQEASLDHAMWFMRPFRADEWLLYDQTSPSAHGGRALTTGRIFNQHGDLVASVVQEGLTRTLASGKQAIPIKETRQ
ncbi:acyl-CoA thioesterase [Corynebacterium variabile]|uniref:Acyl-CoA thioesterase 2 n=1 Tax=Corynebacterium variabile TaxID=1727 RepID=A0A0X2NL59_9CORY|nr:acyl-CoA thioesterase II [Corynebacterium variabile]GEC86125.1 acyl-CoA thioesterase II [Corynebacterium variabile]CUU65519.1 Acyl-CoA thioesterase [Corynebacterium variabile]